MKWWTVKIVGSNIGISIFAETAEEAKTLATNDGYEVTSVY